MEKKNEFYMVLNNNHSNNADNVDNSGHFTTVWDNPLTFNPDDNWQVALTEIDYMYDSHTISTNHSITYWYEEEIHAEVTVAADLTLNETKPHFSNFAISDPKYNVVLADESVFGIRAHISWGTSFHPYIHFESRHKFEVVDEKEWFPDGGAQVAQLLSDGKTYFLTTRRKITDFLGKKASTRIETKLRFLGKQTLSHTHWFTSDVRYDSGAALAKHLRETCSHIFYSVKFDKKMQLQMKDNVLRVQLNNGLNFVLGYHHKMLKKSSNDEIFIADTGPKLNRGVSVFYIYASCCGPTFIENDNKPLLRLLHVANEYYSFGMLFNQMFKKPMYVSVDAMSLNQIQIKICNSAGHVISFPEGGSIILTLHFKNKYSSINS